MNVFVSPIVSRISPVVVSPIHAMLHNGWRESHDGEIYYINIQAGPVWFAGDLIVQQSVADRVLKHSRAARVSSVSVFAFSHEVDIHDGIERKFAQAMVESDARENLERFVKEYASSSCLELAKIVPFSDVDLKNEYEDGYARQFGGPEEPDTWRVWYSDDMVSDYGLIRSMGYIMNRNVFEVLRPFISPLFCHIQPV